MKIRKKDPRRQEERNQTILRRAMAGERMVDLAKEFGLSPGRIYQIIEREKRYSK